MRSYRKKSYVIFIVVLVILSAYASACAPKDSSAPPVKQPGKAEERTLILGTTTTTRDTGLMDALIPAFEERYGIKTKMLVAGTGEVIEMAKQGNVDVVLVHSRKAEDEFVKSGYGINRRDVMYNTFLVVGPKEDPAGISKEQDLGKALVKLYNSKHRFISRGDQSGTHKKELSLWEEAKLHPVGQGFYLESGQGMGDTLMMANEMGAYTLTDSGTWYAMVEKLRMRIVFENNPGLNNPYGIIAVNPEKHPVVHINEASAFIKFITSEEGQKIIKDYKKNGQSLFVPSAAK